MAQLSLRHTRSRSISSSLSFNSRHSAQSEASTSALWAGNSTPRGKAKVGGENLSQQLGPKAASKGVIAGERSEGGRTVSC